MIHLAKYEEVLSKKQAEVSFDQHAVSDCQTLKLDIDITKRRYKYLQEDRIEDLSTEVYISGDMRQDYIKVRPLKKY